MNNRNAHKLPPQAAEPGDYSSTAQDLQSIAVPPSDPLVHTAHRPWPLPAAPWVLAMGWHDLLFAHWPVHPAAVRRFIPAGLELDTFDGMAWIGVVPFQMAAVHPRGLPSMPWLSSFAELNLRTYVRHGGKAGVWFWSLDAANPVAVRMARRVFHLPYYDASMQVARQGDTIAYRSVRTHQGRPAGAWAGRYRPTGPVFRSAPGTLEHWLTERYCLYAADRTGSTVWRGNIHHMPWPLQTAEAEITHNTLAAPLGITFHGAPVLHYAKRLDVVAWWPERVR